MARISGVDLPREKRVEAALTLHLWHWPAHQPGTAERTGISPDTRVRDLTDDEVNRLREIIDKEMRVEGDLRREISHEYQAPDRYRLLSRSASPPRHAGSRSAHAHQCPHAARSEARDWHSQEVSIRPSSEALRLI